MYYGGINAHRTYLTVAITHKEGVLIEEHGRVPIGDGEPILKALDEFRPLEVVVETCPFWPWIYDVLEPTDIGFHLAHASELEAIANAETKTYSVDARLLARRRGPEARAGRPGTEAPRREPIGGCEEPWCRRSRATCARRRTAPWAATTNARKNESGGRRPARPPPGNSVGSSTPCSPRVRYGAGELDVLPAERGELVAFHAAFDCLHSADWATPRLYP